MLEAGSVGEALAAVERTPPDLLLLDIRLSSDARDRGGPRAPAEAAGERARRCRP